MDFTVPPPRITISSPVLPAALDATAGLQMTKQTITFQQVPVSTSHHQASPSHLHHSTHHHTSPAPLQHSAPPLTHPAPLQQAGVVAAPSPLPAQANIPTYEIITSCQPRVMYSNGYYFTTFTNTSSGQPVYTSTADQSNQQSYATYSSPANNNNNNSAVTSPPCFTCSCQCQGSLQWSISPNQTT